MSDTSKIKGHYLHCRHCVASKLPADIEVLADGHVLQLWCRVHDVQIARLCLKNTIKRHEEGK